MLHVCRMSSMPIALLLAVVRLLSVTQANCSPLVCSQCCIKHAMWQQRAHQRDHLALISTLTTTYCTEARQAYNIQPTVFRHNPSVSLPTSSARCHHHNNPATSHLYAVHSLLPCVACSPPAVSADSHSSRMRLMPAGVNALTSGSKSDTNLHRQAVRKCTPQATWTM